jgi:hypothetical protein
MSLKNGDLKGTILDKVSVDEFEPKAGDRLDVIVVAFYFTDEEPAEDLNTFIQRGYIDTLDVEVSPSTDEDGNYLVFVEMGRDDTFPNKFQALLKDVENATGKMDWKVKPYLSDKTFNFNDPELYDVIITDPQLYVPKEEFKMNKKDMQEGIEKFLGASLVTRLTIDGNIVTLSDNNRRKIVAEVVDVGDYDIVIGRNYLSESAFRVGQNPIEAVVLEGILGNCQILPLGRYLCVNRNDQVMLLKNTELDYRK